MSPPEQTRLLNIIAAQTKQYTLEKTKCCSARQVIGLFKPQVTPEQIMQKSKEIAKSVKVELNQMVLPDNEFPMGDLNLSDLRESAVSYVPLR